MESVDIHRVRDGLSLETEMTTTECFVVTSLSVACAVPENVWQVPTKLSDLQICLWYFYWKPIYCYVSNDPHYIYTGVFLLHRVMSIE